MDILNGYDLFYKIKQKQFDLDYNNTLNKDVKKYFKTKGEVEALEWIKRMIVDMLEDDDLEIDDCIKLGDEWN